MNMKRTVRQALTGIDAALSRSRAVFPRVCFFEYVEQPEWFADGEEEMRGHYVQVDVFSKDDATALINEVMDKMATAGFEYQSGEDLYEEDVEVYHRPLRYFYPEERG